MSVVVTVPAPSYRLATVAQFKIAQGITIADNDTAIAEFLDQASDKIVSYCNRSFAMETITETIKSCGGWKIKTTKYPLNAVISISYNGVLIDPSLYDVDLDLGYITAYNQWLNTYGIPAYTMVYNTGYFLADFPNGTLNPYLAPNLPNDIVSACINLANIGYTDLGRDQSVVSETIPDVVTKIYKGYVRGAASGASEENSFLASLNRYRRLNFR